MADLLFRYGSLAFLATSLTANLWGLKAMYIRGGRLRLHFVHHLLFFLVITSCLTAVVGGFLIGRIPWFGFLGILLLSALPRLKGGTPTHRWVGFSVLLVAIVAGIVAW
ncbi:MAG: hypothetical protein KDK33_06255 [Leptospiraceae bacterium]|nr:hypothetical protein [Leptospiraceae bacterium]